MSAPRSSAAVNTAPTVCLPLEAALLTEAYLKAVFAAQRVCYCVCPWPVCLQEANLIGVFC